MIFFGLLLPMDGFHPKAIKILEIIMLQKSITHLKKA